MTTPQDSEPRLSIESATGTLEETLTLLLRIRDFEQALLDLFSAGELNGTTHTCLGQEHVAASVMPLLREEDFVFSNHRGHGHYLARFGDFRGLLAEIMGRDSGVCQGVGGSQHIRRGRYFSTGVQGESIPIAAGCAWQQKREGSAGLALAFVGDGTWGQGALYEALNMSSLWSLPLVVVVENNGIAQSTPATANMTGTIEARAHAFGIDHFCLGGCDVDDLRSSLAPKLELVRREHRPLVIEFQVSRFAPHSKGDDTRPPEEITRLRSQGWEQHYRSIAPELFTLVEAQSADFISEIVDSVRAESPSTWNLPCRNES